MASSLDRVYEVTVSYVKELQEKLKQSEEEKMKLESRLNKIQQNYKTEDDLRKQIRLRESYNLLVQQHKLRNNRNDDLKDILTKIENEATYLTAKTDRLRLLRQNYEAYMEHLYPGWRAEEEFYATYRRNLDIINPFDSLNDNFSKNNQISPVRYSTLNDVPSNQLRTSDSQTVLNRNKDFPTNRVTPIDDAINKDKYDWHVEPVRNNINAQIYKPLTDVTSSLSLTPSTVNNFHDKSHNSENTVVPFDNYFSVNKTIDLDKNKNTGSTDNLKSLFSVSRNYEKPHQSLSTIKPLKNENGFSVTPYRKYSSSRMIVPTFTSKNLARSNSMDNFSAKYLNNRYIQPSKYSPRSRSLSNDKYMTARPLSRTSSFNRIAQDRKFSSYLLPKRSDSLKHDNHVAHLYQKYVMNTPESESYDSRILSDRNYYPFRRSTSPNYSSSSSYSRNSYDSIKSYQSSPNFSRHYNEPYKIMSSYIKQPYPSISRSFSVSSLDDLDYLSKRDPYSSSVETQYPLRSYENKFNYYTPAPKYPALYKTSTCSPSTKNLPVHKSDKATITDENMLSDKHKPEYRKRVHYSDEMNNYNDRDYFTDYNTTSIPSGLRSRRSSLYPSADNIDDKVAQMSEYLYPEKKINLNTVAEQSEEDTSLCSGISSEEPWESKIGKLRKLMNYEPNVSNEDNDLERQHKTDDLTQKSSNNVTGNSNVRNVTTPNEDYHIPNKETNKDITKSLCFDEKKDKEKEYSKIDEAEFQSHENVYNSKLDSNVNNEFIDEITHGTSNMNGAEYHEPEQTIESKETQDYQSIPEDQHLYDSDSLMQDSNNIHEKKTKQHEFKETDESNTSDVTNDYIKTDKELMMHDSSLITEYEEKSKTSGNKALEDVTNEEYHEQTNTDSYKIFSEKFNETPNTLKEHQEVESPSSTNLKQSEQTESVANGQENLEQAVQGESGPLHQNQLLKPIGNQKLLEQNDQLKINVTPSNDSQDNSVKIQETENRSSPIPSTGDVQPVKTMKTEQQPQIYDELTAKGYSEQDHAHYAQDTQGYTAQTYTEQTPSTKDENYTTDEHSERDILSQYTSQPTQNFNQEQNPEAPYQEDTHSGYVKDRDFVDDNVYRGDDSGQQYPQQNETYTDLPTYNQNENIPHSMESQPKYDPNKEIQPQYDPNIESQPQYDTNIESQPQYDPTLESQPQYDPNLESQPQYDPNIKSLPEYNPKAESKPEFDQQMYYDYNNPEQNYAPADDLNPQPKYTERSKFPQEQPTMESSQHKEPLQQSVDYDKNSTVYPNGSQIEQPNYATEGFENYIPQEQIEQPPQEPHDQSQSQPEYGNYPADQQYDQYQYDQTAVKGDDNYNQYYEGNQYQGTDVNNQQYPPQQYTEYPADGSGIQYQDQNYYDQYQNYESQNYEGFQQPGEYNESNQVSTDPALGYESAPPTDVERLPEIIDKVPQNYNSEQELIKESPQMETSGLPSTQPAIKEELVKETKKEIVKELTKESGKEQAKETIKSSDTKSSNKNDQQNTKPAVKSEQPNTKSSSKTDQTVKTNSKTELLNAKSNSKTDPETKGKSPKKLGSQDKTKGSMDKTKSNDQGKS